MAKSPEQRSSDPEPQLTQEEVVKNIPNPEYPYIVVKEKSVSYLGVEVPKADGGRLVPKESEFKDEYFYLEGHHETMREIATSLLLNKPLLLEGGTGVYNKTTIVARMCRDLNANYCKVNFDRETAREDVIGGQTLKVDENGKEKLEWYDGDLMYAIRNGGVAFLDEYNRQSKLAGIINPIIDAILNGRKEITNPYNENERVTVHPDFRLVAAQNPPGFEEGHEYTDRQQLPAETFGRWIYRKLPIEYTEEQENKLFAGMIGEDVSLNIAESEFRSPSEGIPVKELAEVPGMVHWRREIITILKTLGAKSTGAKREMAKNQRQNLYFNPRLKKTIIDYIARFYNGDINETVKNAFETCIVGMYGSHADKEKVRLLLDQASWVPPKVASKRKGLDREKGKDKEKQALIAEIEELKAEIDESGKLLAPEGKEATFELMEFAKEKLGKDFFGPEAVKTAFGIEFAKGIIPEIPYSKEQIEQAKKLGEMLVLQAENDNEGNPLTMERMLQMVPLVRDPESGKDVKLLYGQKKAGDAALKDDCWYKNEEFLKSLLPKLRWRLVGKSASPETVTEGYGGKAKEATDYIDQTKALRDHLESIGSLLELEKEECSDGKLDDIRRVMKSDWKEAAKMLSELKVNQNHRRLPAETLYDIVLALKNNNERLMETTYDWSATLSSVGLLVCVGGADAVGAYVDGSGPGGRSGLLGVVSLR